MDFSVNMTVTARARQEMGTIEGINLQAFPGQNSVMAQT